MTEQEILKEIDENGLIWVHQFSDADQVVVEDLEQRGIITTVSKAEIPPFMNDDYCYIRTGNPLKVGITVKANESWLEKGNSDGKSTN
jgi:hypothetical protein